jgi:hypothetical protein
MPASDHNNVTPQKQGDYYGRSKEVLDQLRTTGHFTPIPTGQRIEFFQSVGRPDA